MPDDDDEKLKERRRQLWKSSRSLQGHGPSHPAAELERVAAIIRERDIRPDQYGTGQVVERFEAEVAELLGKPAARFMPSGCMAQPIALRIWAERADNFETAFHATSHLELHEEHGYRHLHGLNAHLLGDPTRPTAAADLQGLPPLSSLLIELPAREIGGQLLEWAGLVALVDAARSRDIHLHLDGARLWEARAFYDRPLAEICALFDSVYVSFYKGIGALPGAMLLGPEDFIAEAVLWQRRQGGTLYSALANIVSAQTRLMPQIERMAAYRSRAIEVAQVLTEAGATVLPDPPQVNMFHLVLHGARDQLQLRRDSVAEACGIWLFGGLKPSEGTCRCEITIGESAMNIPNDELARAVALLQEV